MNRCTAPEGEGPGLGHPTSVIEETVRRLGNAHSIQASAGTSGQSQSTQDRVKHGLEAANKTASVWGVT